MLSTLFCPRLSLWGACCALALASTGCRQIVGFDEAMGSRAQDAGADVEAGLPPTEACGFPYGTAACASCVKASCCNESSACMSNASCAPYEKCVGTCSGDPQCRAQCEIDSPPGT